MATTLNLIRNSRVFFTTNVAAGTGKVNTTGFTAANTQELTVLDGFTFTQNTNADTITVSEAGNAPVRGQRSFNTSLNPVDFSFSTYIRPNVSGGLIKADESVLWNALFGTVATTDTGITLTYSGALTPAHTSGTLTLTAATSITATGLAVGDIVTIAGVVGAGANQYNAPVLITGITSTVITATYLTAPTAAIPVAASWPSGSVVFHKKSWVENVAVGADTPATAYSEVSPARSNANQLLPFGMVIVVDGITYTIDNCAMDQASIDFGLDGIATIAWTGKGMTLNQLTTAVTMAGTALLPTFSGGLTGTATGKSASATTRYITNKLSTIGIVKNIGGTGAGNTTYNLALTGGNMTIANNLTYVTPANIGVMNVPIGYFTGTRAISGSVSAYLRTGGGATKNTGDLFADMLTDATTNNVTETKYQLSLAIGGSSNATRVEVLVNGAAMQVPTVDAQAVVSTTINFTAQATDNVLGATANYDLANTNDMRVRYFSN